MNILEQETIFLVASAKNGDRSALETLVRMIQKDVYKLAVRFLWHPQDAEDATQEILIRIITGLAGFEGKSSFRTWVYRVASNALLTQKKKKMEQAAMSFDEFGEALTDGLSDAPLTSNDDVAQELLLEEVKIGCTHAMLLCLDRDHRLAYILGEILDLDHVDGAEILDITPAAFRKRLSRANHRITTFMTAHCGLIEPDNPCRCKLRIHCAVQRGHLRPQELHFAHSIVKAKRFPEVLHTIRQLEYSRRVVALYRSHPELDSFASLTTWLSTFLNEIHDEKVLLSSKTMHP